MLIWIYLNKHWNKNEKKIISYLINKILSKVEQED